MIIGLGVNPFDPRGLGTEGVALNSSVEDEAAVLMMGGEEGAATAGIGAVPRPGASAAAGLRVE